MFVTKCWWASQQVTVYILCYFRGRNFQTSAIILNFEELNFAQRHDFENKFSFLLWTNKSFVEFIFKDNVLNEIFENKFPSSNNPLYGSCANYKQTFKKRRQDIARHRCVLHNSQHDGNLPWTIIYSLLQKSIIV